MNFLKKKKKKKKKNYVTTKLFQAFNVLMSETILPEL